MVDKIFSLAEPKEQKGEYKGKSPQVTLKKLLESKDKHIHSLSHRVFRDEIRKCLTWARKRNYGLYLKSAEWKKKRDAVVKRDKGECVFCGDTAQHVHHLTYERVYNESLYDLVAVCNECHKAVHYDK